MNVRIVARAFSALFCLALAQHALADPGGFHVRGGLVTSSFVVFGSSSGFADVGGAGNVGFAVGGGGTVSTGSRSSLQFEAMYVNKGGRIGFNRLVATVDVTVGYFEVPVTFRYTFPIDNARPYAMGGLSLGLKLHSSSSSNADFVLDAIGAQSIDDLLRSTVASAIVGAGVEFVNSPWSAEIRASIGLSEAFDAAVPNGLDDVSNTRLNAFLFLVGYGF